jgi:hypothetical protein
MVAGRRIAKMQKPELSAFLARIKSQHKDQLAGIADVEAYVQGRTDGQGKEKALEILQMLRRGINARDKKIEEIEAKLE